MGVFTFTGICVSCKKGFSFHPNKVPSLNGQPICKNCVDRANIIRKEKGLPPIPYESDAYQESFDEEEDYIDWNRKPEEIDISKKEE